ncbi:MAG: hypothetical protein LC135_08930 [Phycisphaerae bacterium]|jgi:hypothetical protein|nr:hypothetical protein [Phycisphaerae bacterium]MCZ2399975.1 hypothetical protein [Phycisphaerae bacterium]NUN47491.1 hypothetical protein [Candidatus Brocadiia bacterium]HMQ16731.1 hypothetical protein [Phycisphaerae bacterium]
MFNYDWFHHGGLQRLAEEAKRRCADRRFEDKKKAGNGTAEYQRYMAALETRVILYMKDGLTYEMREMADVGMSSALAFECVPVDENYKVGAIVLVVPFDDIARVEVFAVHPDQKPTENLRIPGFRPSAAGPDRE